MSYSRNMGAHLLEIGGETRHYGWGNSGLPILTSPISTVPSIF